MPLDQKQPLGLPFEPHDSTTTTQSIKLDNLGPMVINEDGTMSRITNWQNMTAQEQETTLRVLAKRNKARLEKLTQQEN
jgi:hypothetical protein